MLKTILILVSLTLGTAAFAQELDAASQKALQETQDLMNNQGERQKAIQGDSKAKAADAYVDGVTGGNSKSKDDVYKLAADVFENVVKDANGDPKKMQEAMDAYMRNPAAFADKFTPEQQKRLHDLSSQMPATSPSQH